MLNEFESIDNQKAWANRSKRRDAASTLLSRTVFLDQPSEKDQNLVKLKTITKGLLS